MVISLWVTPKWAMALRLHYWGYPPVFTHFCWNSTKRVEHGFWHMATKVILVQNILIRMQCLWGRLPNMKQAWAEERITRAGNAKGISDDDHLWRTLQLLNNTAIVQSSQCSYPTPLQNEFHTDYFRMSNITNTPLMEKEKDLWMSLQRKTPTMDGDEMTVFTICGPELWVLPTGSCKEWVDDSVAPIRRRSWRSHK